MPRTSSTTSYDRKEAVLSRLQYTRWGLGLLVTEIVLSVSLVVSLWFTKATILVVMPTSPWIGLESIVYMGFELIIWTSLILSVICIVMTYLAVSQTVYD